MRLSMPTLIDKLTRLGFSPQQTLQERRVIVVKENGKEYRLALNPTKACAAYQVDGYIVKEGNKCDKLVMAAMDAHGWMEIFVELKGRDIEHAIKQLEATVQNPTLAHPTIKEKRARIVGQTIPRSNGSSVVERARIRFKKYYQCDLRASSQVCKEVI